LRIIKLNDIINIMNVRVRAKAAIVAATVGLGLTASGCSETVSGAAQSDAATINLLDTRLQLEQSIRFSTSIMGCMALDPAAKMQFDPTSNDLTNYADQEGPDGIPGTSDDGPQSVRMKAGIYNDEQLGLTLGLYAGQHEERVLTSGLIGEENKKLWYQEGMTPEVLRQALGDVVVTGAIAHSSLQDRGVGISMGNEKQTPLIHGLDFNATGKAATLQSATTYSGLMQDVTISLLRKSGIQSCNIG
jgi:hypothetical protein